MKIVWEENSYQTAGVTVTRVYNEGEEEKKEEEEEEEDVVHSKSGAFYSDNNCLSLEITVSRGNSSNKL